MSANTTVNHLAGNRLDRHPINRKEPSWVKSVLRNPETRFVIVRDGENLVTQSKPAEAVYLMGDAAVELLQEEKTVILGEEAGITYVAVDISEQGAKTAALLTNGCYKNLRQVGLGMDTQDAAILGFTRAITYWGQRHQFCGACGAPTRSEEGGHVLQCTGCEMSHFPRTDSAIIVLITHDDRCLLARQASWPKGVYATVAGFLEPGESLEDCVYREVREETGLNVEEVVYHSSQPWPFPCSIMVGFNARATGTEVSLDDEELEDARWFTRQELRDAVAVGEIHFPHKISISYQLVNDWLTRDPD